MTIKHHTFTVTEGQLTIILDALAAYRGHMIITNQHTMYQATRKLIQELTAAKTLT